MGFLPAFIIYILFLCVYGFFVAAVLWHIKEYTMSQDLSKVIIRAFLTVILLLGVLSMILFFNIPLS
ncbi:hypothetical protein A2662_02295 [Candidatus Giovannonibacteria bacterium RIFCSPHIGHO2_01_FULL_45_33]|uniref:Uncharacterized protein n=1 Tax=Candidatus Giovannonibacteria bacterium RIFCSPLOWO2_01_FULL_45_34 TaxID=1798351 RepID=A0A1F5WZ46_9BACT|nr:MAG: hypothetical protein A2662_02295 [Candidatus Giovannonibacteria bacterium RIFCSPHIGHO2_01_FULL_45_33]OGF69397.1 MAG: hypothetical protein A3C73_02845 [Candidatus Giovannonibacteria bacterium RIFCSPHIGHO2_02_FULL_44_11]OGF80924.1 MAG: hypothetical protein A2930_04280 [Candidatus Giovannonibacteria bacterium RIFCSPLOWO2_01_FULL_45_34]